MSIWPTNHIFVKSCLTVDGEWTDWTDKSICSVTCGNGNKNQTRYCASPAPQGAGAECTGSSEQTAACHAKECPTPGMHNFSMCCEPRPKNSKSLTKVDGGWTNWTDSTTCTQSCGSGTKEQVRYCANPPPQSSGVECAGAPQQTVDCNIEACPGTMPIVQHINNLQTLIQITLVHGGWSDWLDSTGCSVSCGKGVKEQTRTCTNPAPADGGEDCSGITTQEVACNNNTCPGQCFNQAISPSLSGTRKR